MALSKREKLKLLVKVKLDELSPFDNLKGDESIEGFIAADGDTDYDQVNPISSYIEKTLDSAADYCLRDLPLELIQSDIEKNRKDISISTNGVGVIATFGSNRRLVRLSMTNGELERDITSFILPSSPLYDLQQNNHTRGGVVRPIAAYSPSYNCIEVYSFHKSNYGLEKKADVFSITLGKSAESVQSAIDDFIALRCASYVLEILGDAEKAGVLMNEYENKKKGILS